MCCGIFRQLALLLWKNYVLRKRKKIRLVVEIIWPLFLFLILMWVRTRGLKQNLPNCYFIERPLPSAGLVPFIHTYICEMNDTCYNYPVYNNYDEKFLNKLTKIVMNYTEVLNSFQPTDFTNLVNFTLSLSQIATTAVEQRTLATAYTRNLTLIDNVISKTHFSTNLTNILLSYNQTLYDILIKSSPNFNLLYNENYSRPYIDPISTTLLFLNISLSPGAFNYLYGADLDQLGVLDNKVDNPLWIRSHLCYSNLSTTTLLFRTNINTTQIYLQDELCNMSDAQLVRLIKLVSSNIDYQKVLSGVFSNTYLGKDQFWIEIILAVQQYYEIRTEVDKIISLVNSVNSNTELSTLFQNFSFSNVFCGGSNASIFVMLSKTNFTYINQFFESLSPRGKSNIANTQKQTANTQKQTNTSSLEQTIKIIAGLNTLVNLTSDSCPITYANTSKHTCLCETIYGIFSTFRGDLRGLWNKLQPIFLGKILYSPSTPAIKQLIKRINGTFETVESIALLLNEFYIFSSSLYELEANITSLVNIITRNQSNIDIRTTFTYIYAFKELAYFMKNIIGCFELDKFVGLENETVALKVGMDMINNNTLWAALIFDDTNDQNQTQLPDKVTYKIRMNVSNTHNTFFTQDRYYKYGPNNCFTCNIDYLLGYIYLQDMIEKSIIEIKTNQSQDLGITTQMTPYPCYINDVFVSAISRTLPLFMVLAWIYTVSMMIKDIVYEKEKRLKEFMRVMGLSNGVHWISWFISAFIIMMSTCIILCIILKFGKITSYSDFSVLVVLFCCFTIATITQCFLISTFFSKANLAAAVGGIIYFLLFLPYTILVNYQGTLAAYQQFLASLSSTVAFSYAFEIIAAYELQAKGINWDNFYTSPYNDVGLSFNHVCLTLLLDALIYMILSWYIENVAPGEYGISRPFYFPFQPSYWCGTKYCSNKSKSSYKQSFESNNEDIQYNDINNKVGVEILNLNKIYSRGRNHALKGLYLRFHENEITAFLGHNGAGKSTTMHILTGLYSPSSGTALINGLDIREHMDTIRSSIGFVPQHNVLFDYMTVSEHLWFYARLKGVSRSNTKAETIKLLSDTGLSNKKNQLSNKLSGGMQRKLSVAIAFIGNSKTVILDEPSAGVDPQGRRGIWDLLFKYKKGRTIVVSTHHMDEADMLGDRIAIIANGELISYSTSYYLKHKYGRGYYLTIAKKRQIGQSMDTINRIIIPDSENTSSTERIVDSGLNSDRTSITQISSNSVSPDSVNLQTHTVILSEQDTVILDFIKARIKNAALVENVGTEITFSISNKPEDTKNYEAFFRDLETNIDMLGIDSIGISDTTLEEIFIKLAKQPEITVKRRTCDCSNCMPCFKNSFISRCCKSIKGKCRKSSYNFNDVIKKEPTSKSSILKTIKSQELDEELIKSYSSYTKMRVGPCELLLQQWYGLLIKRFHRVKRNIKGFIAEIVLPIIFVILALSVAMSVPPIQPRPALEMHPWLYGYAANLDLEYKMFYSEGYSMLNANNKLLNEIKQITNTFYVKPSIGNKCLRNHQIKVVTYTDSYRAGKLETLLTCSDHSTNISNTTIPPNINVVLQNLNYSATKIGAQCVCKSGFPECSAGTGGDIEYRQSYKLKTNDILLDLTNRNVTDWLVNTEFNEEYLRKRYGGFEFLDSLANQNSYDNVQNQVTSFTNFFTSGTKTLTLPINALIKNNRIKVWYNNKGYFAHVSYLNAINNAILRAKLSEQNPNKSIEDVGIISINHPMNYTASDLNSQLNQQLTIDLFVAICMIFALSFIPASFLVFVLEEREARSKQLQFVSGVKPFIYWLANFAWDLINYIVPCLLCIVIFVIFNVKTYMSTENFPCLVALMLLYGWSCIPLMYPLNYLFKIPSTAFVAASCINVFVGVISTMSTSILEQLEDQEPDLKDINAILKPLFTILFPHYCLGRGFLDMSILYNTAMAKRNFGLEAPFSPFGFDSVGRNLVALTVQGFVFFILNIFIEYRFFIRFKPPKLSKSQLQPTSLDDDVQNEHERIMELGKNKKRNEKHAPGKNGEDYIQLKNLTKVYQKLKIKKCGLQKHVAVKSVSVGVSKGECFGLLGVNGAGKTTTFKMLTGEIPVTDGDAYVNGYSVSKQIEKVHQNIGYCPQQDAIFTLLTAKEHLKFYARLRGIPEKYIEKASLWALNRVGLNVFADRIAGDFSGGNKRKLSTAISLVGDPKVICLDEPTSGMDAKARRLLWNDILSLIKENRIVILTSHSMEECEALCTRLVIMVNGEFKCLGSPQHLKSKFGNGYKLTIRVENENNIQTLIDFIKQHFPSSNLTEIHKNVVEFSLPFKYTKLSLIFGKMESNRNVLNIQDYSISQTTLDQVFVNFAKGQKEADGEIINNANNTEVQINPSFLKDAESFDEFNTKM